MTNKPDLYALSQLVMALINEKTKLQFEAKEPEKLQSEIKTRIEEIKIELEGYCYNNNDGLIVQRYFKAVQNRSLQLSNAILDSFILNSDKIFENRNCEEYLQLLNNINVEIIGLLEYIEKYYPEHFDVELPIAISKKINYEYDFRNRLQEIEKINCPLVNLAKKPIHTFLYTNESNTFQELYYLRGLLNLIEDDCTSQCKKNPYNCKLCKSLIRNNFNSWDFTYYLLNSIKELVDNQNGLPIVLNILYYQLKEIKQNPSLMGIAYKKDELSVSDILTNWLLDEINFQKKQFIEKNTPAVSVEKNNESEGFKFETTNPMSLITAFYKVIIEMKVIGIKNRKISKAISFIAGHIESSHTDDPSIGAIWNAYYNYHQDEKTLEALKDIFIRGLNHIKQLQSLSSKPKRS